MKYKPSVAKTIKNVIENSFLLSLLALFLTIPSVFCLIFKSVVYILLKIKHGGNFYGMMDGDETIWAIQEKSLGQIITMFIHTYDEDKNGDILTAFQQQVDYSKDLKQTCPKLFCRRGYFMGYYYFFLDYTQKLVKKMRSYDTIDDLKKLLCEYGSSCEPLGDCADNAMMQLLIGTKPIKWSTNTSKRMYPVIVRTHHSLGDGVSLNCLFIKQLMKNPTEFLSDTYRTGTMTDMRKPQKRRATHCNVFKYLKLLYALLRKERYAPPILRRYDSHILHGRSLSGQKNLVWNNDKHSEYVQKVKDIKNVLPNATFNSVILAAIATTINEYFHLVSPNHVPETITSALVTLPQIPVFNEMVQINSSGNICDIDMTNKYVVCALKLPMRVKPAKLSAIEKINEINEEIDKLKKSLDIEVLILCNRVIAKLLPVPCVKLLMRGFNTTFGISNLPGFARGQLWHGGYIEDLYFWIPNSIDIGIGISIFSSQGRLEMGLIVDKVIISDLDQTQRFLDRIVHHIDRMHHALDEL